MMSRGRKRQLFSPVSMSRTLIETPVNRQQRLRTKYEIFKLQFHKRKQQQRQQQHQQQDQQQQQQRKLHKRNKRLFNTVLADYTEQLNNSIQKSRYPSLQNEGKKRSILQQKHSNFKSKKYIFS